MQPGPQLQQPPSTCAGDSDPEATQRGSVLGLLIVGPFCLMLFEICLQGQSSSGSDCTFALHAHKSIGGGCLQLEQIKGKARQGGLSVGRKPLCRVRWVIERRYCTLFNFCKVFCYRRLEVW